MYKGDLKSTLLVHAGNVAGWRTRRRIVVIESDDWGSIRTSGTEAWKDMKEGGLDVDALHYDTVDALESNEDLEVLFSVLSEFRDKNGNHPVITPMCIMGNPDFSRIEASEFSSYFFQPLHETLKEYPAHDRVLELWKKGFEENLFVAGLHGREHLNVRRYMNLLQSGDEGMRLAFKHRSVGAGSFRGATYPNYLGALYPESLEEVEELKKHLTEAGAIFNTYFGEPPEVFIAPNREEPRELEKTLKQIGVRYLTRSKRRLYPVGDGTFRKEYNWLGKRNEQGQHVIVRNCFFEPVCWGEHQYVSDWVDNCMKEISIAFQWHKPAVISSHRANFTGFLRPDNREKGLGELRRLLKQILQKWPDTEFMSTKELGDTITGKHG